MLTALASLLFFAPAQSRQKPFIATLPAPAADVCPWIEYPADAPYFCPYEFTAWCELIGETTSVDCALVYDLAIEFCCQEKLGTVRPPKRRALLTHLKPAGWIKERLTKNFVIDGKNVRPTQYSINPYARAKS